MTTPIEPTHPPVTPPEIIIWLSKQWIKGHDIDHRQTGTDTSDTWIVFCPIEGKPREALLRSIEDYLDFRPDFRSSLRLTKGAQNVVDVYLQWEKRNKKDLAEYNRLKKKLNL
jgi:hypothetical protein